MIGLKVGVAQCRALDCDSKGCRCESYRLPLLNVDIKPFVKKVRKMYTSEKFRNPDFASGWVYFEKSASIRDVSAQSSPSRLVYFFTKSANYNKLYVRAGRSFFLSPGMVLRHYSDPTMRHLKKKTKAWGYAAEAFEQITSAP